MDTLDLGLKGKVAVVTGGRARRKDILERAVEDIRKATGAEILALAADVSKAADCENVVAATVRQYGGVDILLNDAGTSAAGAFEKVTDDAGRRTST